MNTTQVIEKERERENVIETIFNIILRVTQLLNTQIHHGIEYVCIGYRGLMMKTIRQKMNDILCTTVNVVHRTGDSTVVQKSTEDEVS